MTFKIKKLVTFSILLIPIKTHFNNIILRSSVINSTLDSKTPKIIKKTNNAKIKFTQSRRYIVHSIKIRLRSIFMRDIMAAKVINQIPQQAFGFNNS